MKERPEPSTTKPQPTSEEKIEEQVKEVIAKRFQVEKEKVKPKALLLDLLKPASADRPRT